MTAEARTRWLASLDPGIAPYVGWLDAKGIETFESCEGGQGHAFREPTVRFHGDNSEGFRALAAAIHRELPERNFAATGRSAVPGSRKAPIGSSPFALRSYLQSLHSGRLSVPDRTCSGLIFNPAGHLSSLW